VLDERMASPLRLLTSDTVAAVSADGLRSVAQLFGLPLPTADIDALRTALADQLAAVNVLDKLDLANVNPVLEFDPRWHE
jgi:hypothetical protein